MDKSKGNLLFPGIGSLSLLNTFFYIRLKNELKDELLTELRQEVLDELRQEIHRAVKQHCERVSDDEWEQIVPQNEL